MIPTKKPNNDHFRDFPKKVSVSRSDLETYLFGANSRAEYDRAESNLKAALTEGETE